MLRCPTSYFIFGNGLTSTDLVSFSKTKLFTRSVHSDLPVYFIVITYITKLHSTTNFTVNRFGNPRLFFRALEAKLYQEKEDQKSKAAQ